MDRTKVAPPIPLFYSKAAAQDGTLTYRTTDGREVECTSIREPGKWPDAVQVGETAGDYSGFVRNDRSRAMVGRGRW
jgi:hypothetical protein